MSRLNRTARNAQRLAFMEAEHTYQLVRGMGDDSTPFGSPKVMTGAEAAKLNRDFERKFANSRDPKARLWRWNCIDNPRAKTDSLRKRKIRSLASIMSEPEIA